MEAAQGLADGILTELGVPEDELDDMIEAAERVFPQLAYELDRSPEWQAAFAEAQRQEPHATAEWLAEVRRQMAEHALQTVAGHAQHARRTAGMDEVQLAQFMVAGSPLGRNASGRGGDEMTLVAKYARGG